jgi:hypothetical protein
MSDSKLTKLHALQYCCNPFKIHKKKITKSIINLTEDLIRRNPSYNLELYHKVCVSCRKKLEKARSPTPDCESTSPSNTSTEAESIMEYDVNTSLVIFDQTPIKKYRVSHEPHYSKLKINKMKTAVKRKIALVTGQSVSSSDSNDIGPEIEMVQQLKEKFNETSSKSKKLSILTVLPKSWSRNKIINEFGCSEYLARQSKNLVKEKGVFSTPNPRLGKHLNIETVTKVIEFYNSPDVSRVLPGMKDYVSVKGADGTREKKQKSLILCNLKEAHEKFKELHPKLVGFSKFAELRPKECVLPGASGTHSVCVCDKHQNVKLMMAAIVNIFKPIMSSHLNEPGLSTSSQDEDPNINYICHYRHCLAILQCNPPMEKCYFGKCDQCPIKETFIELLTKAFDRRGIDNVEFRQWVSTDRSTLETSKLSMDDFIQNFHEKLKNLLQHDFIAKEQARFLRQKKNELRESEFLIVGDFAENYAFIVQDAAQSFHWNNSQATLHPFVAYYKDNLELKHRSFVAISDCNQHDVVAVHLFQTRLINFLKSAHEVTKIFYFSDGCAAQYKNRKNFINLCHHKQDFGIEAEWHFFATSHGKGPCDGIGGSVKRLAARSSLQRIGVAEPILDPLALYNFAVTALPSITFTFTTSEEHETHRKQLGTRFSNARTIPGNATVLVHLNFIMRKSLKYVVFK